MRITLYICSLLHDDAGNDFGIIELNDFIADIETDDNNIQWTYSGNIDLSVNIDLGNIATITIPNSFWFGEETITFIAEDEDG